MIGLTYIPNYISEEDHLEIVRRIDKEPWSNELKRRVQHYGYKYDYRLRKIDESMRVKDLEDWMLYYGIFMNAEGYFNKVPDQVIINEYQPGQGISKHIDCEPCFQGTIASVSLLSRCTMEFTQKDKKVELTLEPRSLLVLTGEARYNWCHAIPARTHDGEIARGRRISVTFRNVILS